MCLLEHHLPVYAKSQMNLVLFCFLKNLLSRQSVPMEHKWYKLGLNSVNSLICTRRKRPIRNCGCVSVQWFYPRNSRVGLGFLLCFGEGWGVLFVVLVGWFLMGWGEMGCHLKVQKQYVLYFCSKVDNFSRLEYLRLVHFNSNQMDSFKISWNRNAPEFFLPLAGHWIKMSLP